MDSPIVWSALLMTLGCTLVILEVFIPSGGILGFLAAASIFLFIALAFYQIGARTGFLFLVVAVIAVPTAVVLAFKYWPETPMGRRILLGLPTKEEITPNDARQRTLQGLVGKWGIAKTAMLPSGAITVDGKTVDAVSQGMPIEADQRVVVSEARGNRVVVRPVRDDESPSENGKSDDVLSQPLDALGLDPLDDPLA